MRVDADPVSSHTATRGPVGSQIVQRRWPFTRPRQGILETTDRTLERYETRNVLASHPPSGHYALVSAVESVASRVQALGLAEVGRRYLRALRASDDDPDKWIVDAVWFGEDTGDDYPRDLPISLRWDLVFSALDACSDDDGDLWLLGDGPFDHLAAEPGMIERFYAERERCPKLRRLFAAMRRELPAEGVTTGWWFG